MITTVISEQNYKLYIDNIKSSNLKSVGKYNDK